jgi:hypothetical protein
LAGKVVVHHLIEQLVSVRFPGLITEAAMHSLENRRGIPKELNSMLHLSIIRREMNTFYKRNPEMTVQKLFEQAAEIDRKYRKLFNPPTGEE